MFIRFVLESHMFPVPVPKLNARFCKGLSCILLRTLMVIKMEETPQVRVQPSEPPQTVKGVHAADDQNSTPASSKEYGGPDARPGHILHQEVVLIPTPSDDPLDPLVSITLRLVTTGKTLTTSIELVPKPQIYHSGSPLSSYFRRLYKFSCWPT